MQVGPSVTQATESTSVKRPIRWGRVLGLGVVASLAIFAAVPNDTDEDGSPSSAIPSAADSTLESTRESDAVVAPEHADLLYAGEQFQRQGRLDEALATYARIPQSGGIASRMARTAQASTLLYLGRLVDAEHQLDLLEEIAPDDDNLVLLRAALLTAAGRRWESRPFLVESLLRNLPDKRQTLIYLATLHQMPSPEEDYFAKLQAVSDAYGLISWARVAAGFGKNDRALQLLAASYEAAPNVIETPVQIGQLMLNMGRGDDFAEWQSRIPDACLKHPILWLLRGRHAQESGDLDTALRCYWETLKLDPNQERACYQIGQILAKTGRVEESKPFTKRAGLLAYLHEHAVLLYEGHEDAAAFNRCAVSCLGLGRYVEAAGWADMIEEIAPDDPRVEEIRSALPTRGPQPVLAPAFDLAARFAFDDAPLPTYERTRITKVVESTPEVTDDVVFRFEDQAEQIGVNFQYQNADDPIREGRRMYEYTGGGAAAFDYDGDGFPDLFFPQGSKLPPTVAQSVDRDVLFRNRLGRRFDEVAEEVGIVDLDFGQGVAVGDLNSDGFPDLYVANIGGNRLWVNNGDGTFREATETAITQHEFWTTSTLLADLNADGLPDIYDVTFLQGDNVFTVVCTGRDGKARSCAPKGFEAAPDFVHINQGDGTFKTLDSDAGFSVGDGDGLGIVAADFDNSGELSVFIANDGRPNFYFQPVVDESGKIRQWEENALFSGLAHDDAGVSQACMGIAADDLNHDDFVDLFVTNFYLESNTLYLNMGSSAFLDQTRSFGLREPSLSNLGFGTQFLDADLDGWTDLMLVNGHVDDFSYKGTPFEMKPQLFRNRDGSYFVEQDQKTAGAYFDQPQLGRAMAKLDWNADGRMDFAVSNLGTPVSVVTNVTDTDHSWLAIRLVGTNRSRDAIGTRVRVTAGDLSYERQLTAGDGYQSSNERRLVFGLGNRDEDVTIEITWPGGLTQEYQAIRPGKDYVAVETRQKLVTMP